MSIDLVGIGDTFLYAGFSLFFQLDIFRVTRDIISYSFLDCVAREFRLFNALYHFFFLH